MEKELKKIEVGKRKLHDKDLNLISGGRKNIPSGYYQGYPNEGYVDTSMLHAPAYTKYKIYYVCKGYHTNNLDYIVDCKVEELDAFNPEYHKWSMEQISLRDLYIKTKTPF